MPLHDEPTAAPADAAGRPAYRVLARKYRPTSFAELIGQDALVRTLSNAIASGRIAQAFMLTGVRGVGKTTTARIIARALNCIGADGRGGPTIDPCGVCIHCTQIAQDRHVDVLEMDAASHTGVDDVREILDGVRYAPASARYKLYIIDEVHMLSKNAFNALLKTLEEPPATVKFVFATTEVRKVPITVLSRCQRFDLRRVEVPVLIDHFRGICAKEGVTPETEALALIARAADGSVRDGLSLLDQAIALAGTQVTALQVRDMLGLADRSIVIDLLDAALAGRPAEALAILADLAAKGADPLVVLRDLLDLTHGLTRFKVVPDSRADPGVPEAERVRGWSLAEKLSVPALGRIWQILLKGLGEAQTAPVPQQAVEMVIVRLAYASTLPTPGDLVRRLQEEAGSESPAPASPAPIGPAVPAPATGRIQAVPARASAPLPRPMSAHAEPAAATATVAVAATAAPDPVPADFRALAQLFSAHREVELYGHLYTGVHVIRYEPGLIELRLRERTPGALPNRVQVLLTEWTGRRWAVVVSGQPGALTLAEQDAAARANDRAAAARHPLVRAVLEAFPGAEIREVRRRAPPEVQTPSPAGDEVAVADNEVYLDGFDEDAEFGG